MPTTTTFFAAEDGEGFNHCASSSSDYAIAREGSSFLLNPPVRVGQYLISADYRCFEAFLRFDTSSIPDSAIIDSVQFSLHGSVDNSAQDFTIEARLYTAYDPPATFDDYLAGSQLGTLPLLATFDTSGWSTTGYNVFTLSGTSFKDNINKTGSTEILLCSSRHRLGTAPTGEEYVEAWHPQDPGTTRDPKLVVTYTVPPVQTASTVRVTNLVAEVVASRTPAAAARAYQTYTELFSAVPAVKARAHQFYTEVFSAVPAAPDVTLDTSSITQGLIIELAAISHPTDPDPIFTDITRHARALHTKRGAQKELDRAEAGTINTILDNRDRRFDPDVGGLNYLSLDGTANAYAETPDAATLSPSSRFELRVAARRLTWTPSSRVYLFAKWREAGTLNKSFAFFIDTDGRLGLLLSEDGTTITTVKSSSAPIVPNDSIVLFRVVCSPDTGGVRFYIRGSALADIAKKLHSNEDWTQVGSRQLSVVTGIFNSATAVRVGLTEDGTVGFSGRIYAAHMLTGSASLRAFPKFVDSIEWMTTDRESVDNQQNEWTLGPAATIVQEVAGTLVKPMRILRARMRFSGVTYPMAYAYTDAFDQKYRGHSDAFADVKATDGFKVLASVDTPSSVWELEVRQQDPYVWYRMSDEEDEQSAKNVMDPEKRQGSYLPLARPPQRGDGLNRYDSDGGAYFNPQIAREEAGQRRGMFVQSVARIKPPLTLSVIFMLDLDNLPEIARGTLGVLRTILFLHAGSTTSFESNRYGFWAEIQTTPSGRTFDDQGRLKSVDPVGQLSFLYWFIPASGAARNPGRYIKTSKLLDFADRKPHILTFTFTGDVGKIFVDGVRVKTNVFGGTATWSTLKTFVNWGTEPYFGTQEPARDNPKTAPHRPWWGWLDEAIIDNKAWSERRVKRIHKALKEAWRGDTSDKRAKRFLDFAEWPSSKRNLQSGETVLGRAPQLGGKALEGVLEAAQSEYARCFIDASGVLQFQNRHHVYKPPHGNVQGTYGDGDGELKMFDLSLDYNDNFLVNDATITRPGGEPQKFKDEEAIEEYLKRPVDAGVLYDRDSEALALAEWLVHKYKDPQKRVNELRVRPYADANSLFPQILQREIGDRIRIKRRPPGGGIFTHDLIIEGIEQVVAPGKGAWETIWWLSPADTLDVLVLAPVDDPVTYPNSVLGTRKAPF